MMFLCLTSSGSNAQGKVEGLRRPPCQLKNPCKNPCKNPWTDSRKLLVGTEEKRTSLSRSHCSAGKSMILNHQKGNWKRLRKWPDLIFKRSVYIKANKVYRVGMVLNKVGWYPMGVCTRRVNSEGCFFTFCVGQPSDTQRDGLIRSIIFSKWPDLFHK